MLWDSASVALQPQMLEDERAPYRLAERSFAAQARVVLAGVVAFRVSRADCVREAR
jgi:hypothetical protein